MPGITRLGDSCTGHGAFPPRSNVGASSDVFVNGKAVHRETDPWGVHCDLIPTCHSGALQTGSATVFANGLQLGRIGDPVDCGSSVATGSNNVFAGG